MELCLLSNVIEDDFIMDSRMLCRIMWHIRAATKIEDETHLSTEYCASRLKMSMASGTSWKSSIHTVDVSLVVMETRLLRPCGIFTYLTSSLIQKIMHDPFLCPSLRTKYQSPQVKIGVVYRRRAKVWIPPRGGIVLNNRK